jgi:hypothetical protein
LPQEIQGFVRDPKAKPYLLQAYIEFQQQQLKKKMEIE